MMFSYHRLIPLLLVILFSCNKESNFGTEIIDSGSNEFGYTDTLKMVIQTGLEPFTIVRSSSIVPSSFFAGNLQDPIFGRVEAGFAMQVVADAFAPSFIGNVNARLDSAVLVLSYRPGFEYGDTVNARVNYELFRLQEKLSNNSDSLYRGSRILPFNPVPVGTGSWQVKPRSRIKIRAHGIEKDSFFNVDAQIRIRVSDDLAKEIMALPDSNIRFDSKFTDIFRGLYLKASAGSSSSALPAFSLGTTSSRLAFYYRDSISKFPRTYSFVVNNNLVNIQNFKHDFSTGSGSRLISQSSTTDSLLFLQGMGGPNIELRLPSFTDARLKDSLKFINKAEIELVVKEGTITNGFRSIDQVAMATRSNTGTYTGVIDFLIGGSRFGGVVVNDTKTGKQVVRINVSALLRDALIKNTNDLYYLRVLQKSERPNRLVLYGPGHNKYAPKLKVYYVRLK
jgi:hypothetical protein